MKPNKLCQICFGKYVYLSTYNDMNKIKHQMIHGSHHELVVVCLMQANVVLEPRPMLFRIIYKLILIYFSQINILFFFSSWKQGDKEDNYASPFINRS